MNGNTNTTTNNVEKPSNTNVVNKIESTYVGSDKSNKYHYPDCRWAKKIKPENLLEFNGKSDAEGKGYVPCGTCNP
ncbi:Ada metal-binding domain-containing protein [Anaeromicrobium sediminis]|uniref:Uncharacterized protein n=1 Tax=Anaeromicrobium sediminis TaxID=1478221 RepID=A0A267MNA6_9FIRM|nr:Ada metal-binding domain-containing protein [Anaeromicrobium sediminis]PAB61016.1 hypothetical protein CCE28_00880 [Anaeromicrobium sediminis]